MWRYVGASVPGTSHLARSLPCQDANAVGSLPPKVDDVFWAVIADGAGSARCSDRAAQLVCHGLSRRISRWLSVQHATDVPLQETTVVTWLAAMRTRLQRLARDEATPLREFACTVSGIVVGQVNTVCFQIGDGAIVVGDDQARYEVVFWPANGEYANSTYFLTDDLFPQILATKTLATPPTEIALLSDGLQRLALNLTSQTAHIPFFAPMFHRLAQAATGWPVILQSGLQQFLTGEAVNQRTDDDKTLVLATRAVINN